MDATTDPDRTHLHRRTTRWLHLIRDHLAASLTIEPRDLLEAPFTQHGGLGKANELFDDLPALLDDLNTTLAA